MAGAPIPLRWRAHGARGAVVEAGTWHPRFSAGESVDVLVLAFAGATLTTEFAWI